MLKQLPFLIAAIGLSITSCQTFDLADVAPETRGSALGGVKLGQRNKDFFVIPGEPLTPAQMRGEAPVPPENIVVFKTRERQSAYKVARVAGTPARVLRRSFNAVTGAVGKLAFGWMKPRPRGKEISAGESAASHAAEPQAAHVWDSPQTLRNGG